jgi:hypothetical protein
MGKRVDDAESTGGAVLLAFRHLKVRYEDLFAILEGEGAAVEAASRRSARTHRNFWDTLSYPEFASGPVPFVDSGPGPPYLILSPEDGAASNLALALRGSGRKRFPPIKLHELPP